jgi:hypothetical protein
MEVAALRPPFLVGVKTIFPARALKVPLSDSDLTGVDVGFPPRKTSW